jgi:hypothetical protein
MSKSKLQKRSNKKGVRKLNARDRQIIEDLSWKVRYFTIAQIGEHFFFGCRQSASRRIRSLIDAKLLRASMIVCQEPPAILSPLCSSTPLYDEPDYDKLVSTLHARFKSRRMVSQWVISSSTWADKTFAGICRQRSCPHHQVGHDLGVSESLLFYKQHHPEYYHNWNGEDTIDDEEFFDILPDAVTRRSQGVATHVVEFGGDYHRNRLIKLHETCAEKGVTYDLF